MTPTKVKSTTRKASLTVLIIFSENLPPSSLQDSNVTPRSATTATGFSHLFLSQDDHPAIDNITAAVPEKIKKPKRTRLLLDARIELTDEELKVTNPTYPSLSPSSTLASKSRLQICNTWKDKMHYDVRSSRKSPTETAGKW
jgi:hypothetical protein